MLNVNSVTSVDLPQVDLMNFRVEFVRPRSGRFWGSERRSRERSTCLAWRVFVFVSRQKWGVAWLVTGVSGNLVNWTAKIIGSTPTKTIERVCVSKSSKEQICLLCTEVITDKDFRRKLMISGGQKKTKACLNLACIAWRFKKQFERDCTQHRQATYAS